MRKLTREPTENRATSRIRNAIIGGELAPGTRLRQVELAQRLGISRMPVRQALSILQREGLVKIDGWRRTIVAPLDAKTVSDIYAFRSIVEPYVCATLARRADFNSARLREVVAAGQALPPDGSLSEFIDADLIFHRTLYEAVGNRILSDVMQGQWSHLRRVMAMTLALAGYRERIWEEHDGILTAIEKHDSDLAARLAEAHMTAAQERVIDSLSGLEAPRKEPLYVAKEAHTK